MQVKNKQVRKYIKELKMYLPIFHSNEKRYISDMTRAMEDYTQDNKEVEMEDLIKEFGEPKDMAANYIKEADADVLGKTIIRSRYLKIMFSIVVFSILIYIGIKCSLTIITFNNLKESYIEREVIEIQVEE